VRERPAEQDVGVMTVDDQAAFRSAARAVVNATRGFRTLAEAGSAIEALAAVERVAPQLVLMDVRMPGADGVEATRRLLARRPQTVVILVSAAASEQLPADCGTCGAAAVLPKQDLRPAKLAELWRRYRPDHVDA
jgi:two-component system invasion response regulator UvrY